MNAALSNPLSEATLLADVARTGLVERYVWRPIPTSAAPQQRPLSGATFWVMGGEPAARLGVEDALSKAGARVAPLPRLDTDEIMPVTGIDGIVDLNLEPGDLFGDRSAWRPAVAQTLRALKAVYQDWASETDARRLLYLAVTRLGGEMGYGATSEGGHPLTGIWAGLAKSLPRELPNLKVRVLDLPIHCPNDAQLVVTELAGLDGLIEVGWRDGKRQTLASTREAAPERSVELGPPDHVLISGGARGIGFALALALARGFGCRVTVTGRSALAEASAEPVELSKADFAAYRARRLSHRQAGEGLRAVREDLARIARLRELRENLDLVREAGLPLQYERCDFADSRSVRDLIGRIAPVTVLVHNAGVDTPLRLSSKSIASCLSTIAIKLDGFLHLVEHVPRAGLKAICCVGSLTGRLGGMVGQIDYGAANDGLCRLAQHVAASCEIPVKTLCFPTWERLGMVSNYEATLKYMTPLGVAEGVRHWLNELLSAGQGEVTFMGEVGPALSPLQLGAYPAVSELPGVERLRALIFASGRPLSYAPERAFRTLLQLPCSTLPAFQEFLLDGQPALPVSCLLELALAAARWLTPAQAPQPISLRQLLVDFAALRASADLLELEIDAARGPDGIAVDVRAPTGRFVASMRLGAGAPGLASADRPLAAAPPAVLAPGADGVRVAWRHLLWRAPEWRGSEAGLAAVVAELTAHDVWAAPSAPEPTLSLAAVEALLFALLAPHAARAVTRVECGTLLLWPLRAATQLLTFQPERGDGSSACAKTGATLLEARGLRATFA